MSTTDDATPEIGMVIVTGCRCRCGHEWLPRSRDERGVVERPTVCPLCKSPRWDKPFRKDGPMPKPTSDELRPPRSRRPACS